MFGKRGQVQMMMITILAFLESTHSIGVASHHRRLARPFFLAPAPPVPHHPAPPVPHHPAPPVPHHPAPPVPHHPAHPAWPQDEEVCGGNFGCSGDMTGYSVNMASPAECRDTCSEDPNCNFFTFFKDGMFSSICFQFKSCDKLDFECHDDCFSGPKCDDCPTCRRKH